MSAQCIYADIMVCRVVSITVTVWRRSKEQIGEYYTCLWVWEYKPKEYFLNALPIWQTSVCDGWKTIIFLIRKMFRAF